MAMTTPHPRPIALALLLLLAGGALRAEAQSPRPNGGHARLDRDDMALLARAFPGTYRVETMAARAYDRYPAPPQPVAAPAPQQRRTMTSYYPAMGTGQYTNRVVHPAHCTPSRVSLMVGR
jgi:hypothetical protein